MPDQPAGPPRRRSAVEPGAMTSALFSSFTQPAPAPADPGTEPPAAAAAPAAVEPPAPAPVGAGAGRGPSAAPAAAETRAHPAAGRAAVDQPPRPAPARPARPAAPPRRPAPTADAEGPARPGRPGRPRLVEPTAYATKHREVKIARVQTLLREGDLHVLDELARLTEADTGEDTNRSELLRALVEAVDASGIAEELAGCGTHRQRVAFLAARLRGSE